MKDVVIVTAFNRAEMLLLCLEHLAACDLRNTQVIVSEDARSRPSQIVADMNEVICRSRKFLDFEYVRRLGCQTANDNIWGALCESQNYEFVYTIEDDSIVESDFITWHQRAQAQFHPFVSCADNYWATPSVNANEVGLSHSDFATRACCMSQETLQTILKRSMEKPFEEVLQGYLIEYEKAMVFPTMPRSHNIEVAGTNLGNFYPTGTLNEKIAQIRNLIRLEHPRTADDFVVGVDRTNRWEKAYKAQSQWGFQ
jgi:hypothetical protein